MNLSTPSSHQLYDIFGAGYLQEQHGEIAQWKLPPSLIGEINTSLTMSMFDEILKSLRAALSLN